MDPRILLVAGAGALSAISDIPMLPKGQRRGFGRASKKSQVVKRRLRNRIARKSRAVNRRGK